MEPPVTFVALALMVFSTWHVPGRLARWLAPASSRRARVRLAGGPWGWRLLSLALACGFIAILMTGWYATPSPLAGLLYNLLGFFLIFQVYLFILTVAVDAIFLFRRKAPGRKAAALVICASALLIAIGAVKARNLAVTEIVLPVAGLEAPVSIVHAPDMHLGNQRGAAWLARTVETINGLSPDLVIYNGDLADSDAALVPEVYDLFRKVDAPQYYTTGNHEYYINTALALAMAEASGLIVLRNQVVEIMGLQLAGLEYMNADSGSRDAHRVNDLTIAEELPKLPLDKGRPIAVVHHSPVGLAYVEAAGADVMLSGHTHGGQVFPGTILIRLRFPFFRGRYQVGGTTLLVSMGAGTFGPWLRLGSYNEIQLVRLVPAERT
jgi:predicted MPP superfamily phosphohydrolase